MQCLHFLSCSVIIRGSAPIIIFKYKKYTIFTIISVVTYSDKMFHCELLETFLLLEILRDLLVKFPDIKIRPLST